MDKVICSNCGKEMVLRTRRKDGVQFYGCRGYPVCRNTKPYNGSNEKPAKAFKPSIYQQAIFDYIQDPDGTDAVVEAVAGSGKTTTLVEALKFTSGRVAFVAFNKRIADELARRAPDHVVCRTLHSLGFKVLQDALPHKPIVDDKKKRSIAKELLPEKHQSAEMPLIKLASLVQATLTDPTDRFALAELITRYDIDANDDEDLVISLMPRMIELCATRTNVIDYDDMIWLPVHMNLPTPTFDWLFVDEAQDLNKCQIELVLRSVDEYGRIVAVGDRYQSIYGFRGADTDAIPRLIDALNGTKVLPLSITYRCPVEHVKLARRYVPHLEAAEWAESGVVRNNVGEHEAIQRLQSGDMVLCRVNAPLVKFCFSILNAGKKAIVVGRDIGEGLIRLIDKVSKPGMSIEDLLAALGKYEAEERTKFLLAGRETKAESLSDRVECISIMAEGRDNVTSLKARISDVFRDEISGVACSTVHKAKGLEADNVFVLEPHKLGHSRSNQSWVQQQEANVAYVTLTRAKKELNMIGYWDIISEDE